MFTPALRIALAKTNDPTSCAALEQALLRAESLARVEADFEAKINSSKARRGEKPTKLSKSRRAQLDEYAQDASTLEANQLAVFESELSASEILTALKSGLDVDLKFWANAAKYTHPDDLPVVQEFVKAKLELQASLALCLASGPCDDA
jgi:hypothetical protein